MKRSDIPDMIAFLLILMFSYAAISKLITFSLFRIQLFMQPLPKWSIKFLAYAVPLSEIITVISLLFKKTKIIGLYGSFVLMLAFTVYTALAVFGFFGVTPCSCGGIISKMTWPEHMIFNLIFLIISIYGLILNHKERRFIGK